MSLMAWLRGRTRFLQAPRNGGMLAAILYLTIITFPLMVSSTLLRRGVPESHDNAVIICAPWGLGRQGVRFGAKPPLVARKQGKPASDVALAVGNDFLSKLVSVLKCL